MALLLDGQDDDSGYISIYRRSSNGEQIAGAVPHIGPGGYGTVANAGRYTSPAFLAWVEQNIDPVLARGNQQEVKNR